MSNYGQKQASSLACSPPAKTEMPESTSHLSFDEVAQAWEAFNQSEIAHPIRQLNYVLERNIPLSQWEIDQVNKIMTKFTAKYNSPLAKAMK